MTTPEEYSVELEEPVCFVELQYIEGGTGMACRRTIRVQGGRWAGIRRRIVEPCL